MILSLLALVIMSSQVEWTATPIQLEHPKNWPTTTYDQQRNPLTKEGVWLGRNLFYDPQLSKNNTINCASCHLSFTAFTHVDHSLSHGINDRIGTRNSPVLINLAWNKSFMWDGASNHLDVQALAPLSHPDEMGEDIKNVVEKLSDQAPYKTWTYEAFGDSNLTGERLLKALAQFQLTLISATSKYDKIMSKQAAFTDQESNGYSIFKANCNSCHTEPLFTNGSFQNNGLSIDSNLNDLGRFAVSQNPEDKQKFKVPTLRNIEFSHPYMHDGRFQSLNEAIKHYQTGIKHSATLAPELAKSLTLTERDRIDLVAFLLTLTDKEFLFNPAFGYPRRK
jgi:cytochrome c peroxidase